MGAIVGVIDFDIADPADVPRMGAAIATRASGDLSRWHDGPAALGFRPRRAGTTPRQPVVSGDLVVVLDGWVYEHEDLARTAGAEPGLSDTESVASAWFRWGPTTPERMEGDFAIVVWNRATQRLHLVRDPLGVRPLYWTAKGRKFAFASDPEALFALPWVQRSVAWNTVSEYLAFQVVHAPRTLLEGIFQLEPGHLMEVGDGIRRSVPWWTPYHARPSAQRPRERDLVEALNDAVIGAVRRRIPKGRPTGLYLSGGLGSTAIAVAARSQNLALPAFTVALDDEAHPESPFAGRVARLLGLPEHHEIRVGSADVASTFDEAVSALGHPVGQPSATLQLLLGRRASASVEVALSGDGGDELFGGRMLAGLSRRLAFGQMLERVPAPARRLWASVLIGAPSARKALTDPQGWPLTRGLGGRDLFSDADRQSLFRDPELVRPGLRQEILHPFYDALVADPINTVLWGWLRSWLAEGALPLAERTAAAAGLDLRFPLLDRAVLSAAFALPGTSKVGRMGGSLHTRWPLRALLTGALPPALIDRPKRGLPVLPAWLARSGRLFFEARFARLRSDPSGPFNPAALDLLRARLPMDPEAGTRLWSLFILDAWLRNTSRGNERS